MSEATAAEVLAAYRKHIRPGDTVSIGYLADYAGVPRSHFMAAVDELERVRGVEILRAGAHPNDVWLTVT